MDCLHLHHSHAGRSREAPSRSPQSRPENQGLRLQKGSVGQSRKDRDRRPCGGSSEQSAPLQSVWKEGSTPWETTCSTIRLSPPLGDSRHARYAPRRVACSWCGVRVESLLWTLPENPKNPLTQDVRLASGPMGQETLLVRDGRGVQDHRRHGVPGRPHGRQVGPRSPGSFRNRLDRYRRDCSPEGAFLHHSGLPDRRALQAAPADRKGAPPTVFRDSSTGSGPRKAARSASSPPTGEARS